MYDSTYPGFDNRAREFFTHLALNIDRVKPHRMRLKRLFIDEVRRVLPFLSAREITKLRESFNIAYFAYNKVRRRDGEAYIFHVVRAELVLIWSFGIFRVFDIDCCHTLFQHDAYEEADDTWYAQMLIRSVVRFVLGETINQNVVSLTQGEDESDVEYSMRMLIFAQWRSLLVKFVERADNIWKLEKNDVERSKRKLRDTEEWFPRLERRLLECIELEIETDQLKPEWLNVAKFLTGYLWYAVEKKKDEFGLE